MLFFGYLLRSGLDLRNRNGAVAPYICLMASILPERETANVLIKSPLLSRGEPARFPRTAQCDQGKTRDFITKQDVLEGTKNGAQGE